MLGKKGKDSITGFTGIIMARCVYMTGCNRLLLVPRVGKDGKILDGEWFDEERINVSPERPVDLPGKVGKGADIDAPKN